MENKRPHGRRQEPPRGKISEVSEQTNGGIGILHLGTVEDDDKRGRDYCESRKLAIQHSQTAASPSCRPERDNRCRGNPTSSCLELESIKVLPIQNCEWLVSLLALSSSLITNPGTRPSLELATSSGSGPAFGHQNRRPNIHDMQSVRQAASHSCQIYFDSPMNYECVSESALLTKLGS